MIFLSFEIYFFRVYKKLVMAEKENITWMIIVLELIYLDLMHTVLFVLHFLYLEFTAT